MSSNKSLYKSNIKISLIIPVYYNDVEKFKFLIKQLKNNTKYLFEIIAVFSNMNRFRDKYNFEDISLITDNKLVFLFNEKICFPGEARNIGLKIARGNFIAFLDVNTIPPPDWLKTSLALISNNESFLGRTEYQHTNNFSKIFIAATYGYRPLFTVPGSLIKKDLFSRVGWFIPNVRSGEDSDWIRRSLHFSPLLRNTAIPSVKYIGLKDKKFLYLCRKWFKFTITSSRLQIHQRQKYIYLLIITNCIVIFSFNWNAFFSGWDINNQLYIPHITKITTISIVALYIFIRIILIPLRKGVKLKNFNIIDFLNLLVISIIIDTVKLAAFVQSSLISLIKKYNTNYD
tara:strand:+ start:13894 stop:14925 length:1032 start_codon:yes stop_codon:yes gene_type:complete